MNVLVLGAGIIGTSTAWHLQKLGHNVTLVDRQADAALETSFGNAGQISVSYCEPWASKGAPLKILKWMFDDTAPLLFRPQFDMAQWLWGLKFLRECTDAAFMRNVKNLVALGAYSHETLKTMVATTGIRYHRLEKGIGHYFTDAKAFAQVDASASLMRTLGVERRVVTREELLKIEPALTPFAHEIVGGTYTASDESGDARLFTQGLAKDFITNGGVVRFKQAIERLHRADDQLTHVTLRDTETGERESIKADAYVVACGSYTAPLLRAAGVSVPIYPGKGYSATLKILRPEAAPDVSVIDDTRKCAMTRMGDHLRVAGTIELAGLNLDLNTPLAQRRCTMLTARVEEVMPGVVDTRSVADGGDPQFWCGLRPATPTNVPLIGQTAIKNCWINAGHGTLGWTHGAGSGRALAELMSGQTPRMAFDFYNAR